MSFASLKKALTETFKQEVSTLRGIIDQGLDRHIGQHNTNALLNSPLTIKVTGLAGTIIGEYHIQHLIAIYKKEGWQNVCFNVLENRVDFYFNPKDLIPLLALKEEI